MTTADPVTLAPGADPIPVLRAMAKFLPGEDRGLAEIRSGITIGLAALIGHPEKAPLPLFDASTRVVAVLDLATWLRDRGFEASACRWERRSMEVPSVLDPALKWILTTGPSRVPPLPPEPLGMQQLSAMQLSQFGRFGPSLGGMARSMIEALGDTAKEK